jgi:hypothetical protein
MDGMTAAALNKHWVGGLREIPHNAWKEGPGHCSVVSGCLPQNVQSYSIFKSTARNSGILENIMQR